MIVSSILERSMDSLWPGPVDVGLSVVILTSSITSIVGMGSWEVAEINIKDWRREKSVMLSLSIIRALEVDPKDNKKVKIRLRNKKSDKLIYTLK